MFEYDDAEPDYFTREEVEQHVTEAAQQTAEVYRVALRVAALCNAPASVVLKAMSGSGAAPTDPPIDDDDTDDWQDDGVADVAKAAALPDDHTAAELLAAAVEVAQRARDNGTDPEEALDALHALGMGGTFEKAGWSSEKHPRGDDGKFVRVNDIKAAKKDPAKAAELRKNVTDPEERKKLDHALHSDELSGSTRDVERHASQVKREKVQANRAVAKELRKKLSQQIVDSPTGEVDPDDARALIPHLSTMTHAELSDVRKLLDRAGATFGRKRLRADRVAALVAWAESQGKADAQAEPEVKPEAESGSGAGVPDGFEIAEGSNGFRSRKDAEQALADRGRKDGQVAKVGNKWFPVVPAKSGTAAAASSAPGSTLAAASAKEFGSAVKGAAQASEIAFGGSKVFLHTVYDQLKQQDPALTREDFARKLWEAHQAGHVKLTRADLVQFMHPDDVRDSEIAPTADGRVLTGEQVRAGEQGAMGTFHFVSIDNDGKQRTPYRGADGTSKYDLQALEDQHARAQEAAARAPFSSELQERAARAKQALDQYRAGQQGGSSADQGKPPKTRLQAQAERARAANPPPDPNQEFGTAREQYQAFLRYAHPDDPTKKPDPGAVAEYLSKLPDGAREKLDQHFAGHGKSLAQVEAFHRARMAEATPEPTPRGTSEQPPAAVPPEHRQYVERMDRAEKQAEEEIASVAWNTAQANKAPHSRNNPEKVSDESKRVTRATALLPHWKHAVQNGRAEVAAEAARRMRAHGAAELHAVGETVPFDGRTMEAQVGVNEGDPVRVTRHGWHVPGRPGEPIGRAQVEPVSGTAAATNVDTGGAGGNTTPTQGGSAMNENAGGGDPPKVPPVASGAGDGGMSRREAAAHIGNLLSDYDSDLSYNVFGRKDGRVGVAVTETRKKGKKQVSEEIGIIHINPDGSVEVPPEIKHYLRYGGGPKVHDAISSVRARAEAVEPIGRAQVEPVSGSGAAPGVDSAPTAGQNAPTQPGGANVNQTSAGAGGAEPPKVPPVASGTGDDLPPLRAKSDNQRDFAHSKRQQALKDAEAFVAALPEEERGRWSDALAQARGIDSARWWLDHQVVRGASGGRALLEQAEAVPPAVPIPAESPHPRSNERVLAAIQKAGANGSADVGHAAHYALGPSWTRLKVPGGIDEFARRLSKRLGGDDSRLPANRLSEFASAIRKHAHDYMNDQTGTAGGGAEPPKVPPVASGAGDGADGIIARAGRTRREGEKREHSEHVGSKKPQRSPYSVGDIIPGKDGPRIVTKVDAPYYLSSDNIDDFGGGGNQRDGAGYYVQYETHPVEETAAEKGKREAAEQKRASETQSAERKRQEGAAKWSEVSAHPPRNSWPAGLPDPRNLKWEQVASDGKQGPVAYTGSRFYVAALPDGTKVGHRSYSGYDDQRDEYFVPDSAVNQDAEKREKERFQSDMRARQLGTKTISDRSPEAAAAHHAAVLEHFNRFGEVTGGESALMRERRQAVASAAPMAALGADSEAVRERVLRDSQAKAMLERHLVTGDEGALAGFRDRARELAEPMAAELRTKFATAKEAWYPKLVADLGQAAADEIAADVQDSAGKYWHIADDPAAKFAAKHADAVAEKKKRAATAAKTAATRSARESDPLVEVTGNTFPHKSALSAIGGVLKKIDGKWVWRVPLSKVGKLPRGLSHRR